METALFTDSEFLAISDKAAARGSLYSINKGARLYCIPEDGGYLWQMISRKCGEFSIWTPNNFIDSRVLAHWLNFSENSSGSYFVKNEG